MTKVLFVWERGGGLGHAAPLIALARAMVARRADIRPVFAFRETIYTRILLGDLAWPILPAPWFAPQDQGSTSEASYAQTLLAMGFNRVTELAAIAAGWDDIFSQVEPALIVAENSPFVCLAARGRIPVLVTGTAFNVPPSDTAQFPPFRRGIEPPAVQRRLCDACNKVLLERGQLPLDRLPQLLAGDARAVLSLPHLDPYGPLRRDPLLGPYHGRLRPSPTPERRSIYLYSRTEEAHCDDIVEVLLDLAVPVTAFISGPEAVSRTLLRNRGATVFERLPDLAEVLGGARLVISHGGAGLASAALAVGRAQLLVPNHAEAQVNAARVEATGSGMAMTHFDRREFRQRIEAMLEVRHFHERASGMAAEVAALDLPADPAGAAAEIALGLL